jgi:hypothetical protein
MSVTIAGNSNLVLQVVQGGFTGYTTYSSSDVNAFADVTGFTATITPTSSTSKILVMASTSLSNERVYLRFMRNSTAIAIGDANGSSQRATMFNTAAGGTSVSYQFLDSPATTSAITYKIQVGGESGKTFYIGSTGTVPGTSSFPTIPSTIILMEIAA